ncbi:MAG: cell division protein FtsZ [Chitinophagales bacterium]|nr:cell division protein FtsZ [Chitinophagales bacterium]MDW8392938.1 cell division protein FtsZ [Chitinophagales bacterium]
MGIQFDLPGVETNSIIKVIGVGGGGGNAVNHMYRQGIVGVNFVVANTDRQALDMSPVPCKVQLGRNLTDGRGAGMNPEVGRRSALESIEEIKAILAHQTRMLFVTAGMGKGTGTGAAPVIAELARELNILTVGLVTLPFNAEGPRRYQQAQEGIAELKKHVDTLIIVSNEKLREMYGNQTLSAAFAQADNILANAAKSIAEIITVPGYVNVDFEDVNTVMRNSGVAIMGMAAAEGENRALQAVQTALNSPLLNDNDIRGARNILVNISSGAAEVTLDEVGEITEYVQREAGFESNLIWGNCYNESLGEKIMVTVIATGFKSSATLPSDGGKRSQVLSLNEHAEKPEAEGSAKKKTARTSVKPDATQLPLQLDGPEHPAVIETPNLTIREVLPDHEQQDEEEEFVLHERPVSETMEQKNQNALMANASAESDRNKERKNKLRALSVNLTNPSQIADMERIPAYKRRSAQWADVPHSSESARSEFVLGNGENAEQQAEVKRNNRFLHGQDRVD